MDNQAAEKPQPVPDRKVGAPVTASSPRYSSFKGLATRSAQIPGKEQYVISSYLNTQDLCRLLPARKNKHTGARNALCSSIPDKKSK